MTTEQRARVRKLQDKICTRAVEYKGVREKECARCESPCGYGVELISCLGVEQVKPQAVELPQTVVGRAHSMRRVIRSINRRWRH